MAEIESTGRLGAPKWIDVVRALAMTPFETATRVFYFLRHGQTDGNLNRFYQGPETALNATGRSQAAAAAAIMQSVAHAVRMRNSHKGGNPTAHAAADTRQ